MDDLLNKIVGQIGDLIPSWVPWVAGGSTVGLIVVALLAPSVLTVASSWLSALAPLIKGAAEAITTVAKALWAGFMDMSDNGRSILFVGAVAAIAYLWGYSHGVDTRLTVRAPVASTERIVPLPVQKPSSWKRWLQL